MRKVALAIAGAAGCVVAVLSTSSSEAGRSHGYSVPSNVSYDVCKRRLNRGHDCLYAYWQPLGWPDYFTIPDRRYHRTYWSFWPWW
jgi:hypothetical protein